MNKEVIDNFEEKASNDVVLKNALKWWEKKRIWFNIFVAASGIIPLILYAKSFNLEELILIVFYGLVVNVFYSLGFLLEAFNEYYFKQRFCIEKFRYPFLIFGILMSSGLTFIWALIALNFLKDLPN